MFLYYFGLICLLKQGGNAEFKSFSKLISSDHNAVAFSSVDKAVAQGNLFQIAAGATIPLHAGPLPESGKRSAIATTAQLLSFSMPHRPAPKVSHCLQQQMCLRLPAGSEPFQMQHRPLHHRQSLFPEDIWI